MTGDVAGAPVSVLAVREFKDGLLTDATSEFHAQAPDGTVYDMGEEVNPHEDGQLVGNGGHGVPSTAPARPARSCAPPCAGDRYAQAIECMATTLLLPSCARRAPTAPSTSSPTPAGNAKSG